MKKALISTGHNKINKALYDKINSEKNMKACEKFVHFKEGVSDSIKLNGANILITSDFLEGSSLTRESYIQQIRSKNPDTRIIYLLTEDDKKNSFEKFLYGLSVFDVVKVKSGIGVDEILSLINKRKEWKDVYFHFKEMTTEDLYSLNKNTFEIDIENEKIPVGFENFPLSKSKNEDLLLQIASFWSARAQSGTTFLSTNTALFLAQNKNSKILLVDLNLDNPNIHLHMSLNDETGDKNFSALTQDLLDGKVNKLSDIGNYLMEHPFHKNIDILCGNILNESDFEEKEVKSVIGFIIKYSRKFGYDTVLFDLTPGFKEEYIKYTLDQSDKIIFPFLETPGSIITFQKFFNKHDSFFRSILDVNKMFPVMNQTTETNTTSNFSQIASSVIHRSVYAHVPKRDEIHYCVANGIPILNNSPDSILKREFIDISNCIHDVYEMDASTAQLSNERKPSRGVFRRR